MKKSKLKQQLDRELRGVRVSDGLKKQILAEAVASRAPSRQRGLSLRPLAAAAAVMVICGLTAGIIALRSEKPDLSATPLSQAKVKTTEESASALSQAKIKTTEELVWVRLPEGLYHAKSDCEKVQDPICMQLDTARAAGLKGCSNCIDSDSSIGSELIWMTGFGSYYHSIKDCSGMEDAFGLLEIEAKTLGRLPCPICMEGAEVVMPTLTPWPVTPEPTGGEFAPLNEESEEIQWAPSTPEPTVTPAPEEWVADGPAPTAAPTAAPEEADSVSEVIVDSTEQLSVWMTDGGVYYHSNSGCSGMVGAHSCAESEAIAAGKQACPVCLTDQASMEAMDGEDSVSETVAKEILVWVGDEDGVYYHSDEYCASYFTAGEARAQGNAACAVCAEDVSDGEYVWFSTDGHFHRNKYCSERDELHSCAESKAVAMGRTPCVLCMNPDGTAKYTVSADLYSPEGGKYYHTDEYCAGKEGEKLNTTVLECCPVSGMLAWGKLPCPACAKQFAEVWVGEDGFYHLNEDCANAVNVVSMTGGEAVAMGLEICPECHAELVLALSECDE